MLAEIESGWFGLSAESRRCRSSSRWRTITALCSRCVRVVLDGRISNVRRWEVSNQSRGVMEGGRWRLRDLCTAMPLCSNVADIVVPPHRRCLRTGLSIVESATGGAGKRQPTLGCTHLAHQTASNMTSKTTRRTTLTLYPTMMPFSGFGHGNSKPTSASALPVEARIRSRIWCDCHCV